jgi:aryl sulfotransferase
VRFTDDNILFPQAASRDIFDQALCIESSDLAPQEDEILRPRLYKLLARQATEPMVRRVHSAFVLTEAGEQLFPAEVTLGVVYIVRDPRDVAVSYAHYMSADTRVAIEAMRDPAAAIGSGAGSLSPLLRQRLLTWSGHVESWLDAGLRILPIRYEDMLADPAAALSRVVSFLGWSVDAQAISAAVESTRFDRLRSEEEHHGFESRLLRAGPFFRRGVAGGWSESLTADQVAQIERDHGRVMKRLGYLKDGGV